MSAVFFPRPWAPNFAPRLLYANISVPNIDQNVTNTIVGLLFENITGAQGVQIIQSFLDDPVTVLIDSSLFARQTHDTGFYNLRIVYEAPGTYTNTQPNQNLGIAQGNENAPAPEPLVVPQVPPRTQPEQ